MGHVKISLTQCFKKKKTSSRSKRSKNSTITTNSVKSGSNGSYSVGSASASTASSSNVAAAPSFTGGDACGWIIQMMDEGPTIYHTGDTSVLSDIGIIDELYRPSHVIMPIGE